MTHNRLNFLLYEYNTLEQIVEKYGHLTTISLITQYYNDNELADMIQKYDKELYKKMINEGRKSKKKNK